MMRNAQRKESKNRSAFTKRKMKSLSFRSALRLFWCVNASKKKCHLVFCSCLIFRPLFRCDRPPRSKPIRCTPNCDQLLEICSFHSFVVFFIRSPSSHYSTPVAIAFAHFCLIRFFMRILRGVCLLCLRGLQRAQFGSGAGAAWRAHRVRGGARQVSREFQRRVPVHVEADAAEGHRANVHGGAACSDRLICGQRLAVSAEALVSREAGEAEDGR